MSAGAIRTRTVASVATLLSAGTILTSACSSSASSHAARSQTGPPHAAAAVQPLPARPASPTSGASPTAIDATGPAHPARQPTLALAGKVVGIDPGHNGHNYTDPSFINHLIWNGRELETCDTTGTETDGGYTEAQYNFNVARYLTADLHAEGAKLVLTRSTNDGVGPCVNTRSAILNRAHANVAIDIHADGGPADGRGFTILEPVADGPNDRVIAASERFGRDLLRVYRGLTGMPESTYDGVNGISYRDDLAGLNLTTVPKVLIETGNMRNATDAAMLVRPSFQRLAARAMALAITQFLARPQRFGARAEN